MLRLAILSAAVLLALGCCPTAPVPVQPIQPKAPALRPLQVIIVPKQSDLELKGEAAALARGRIIEELGPEKDNWEFHVQLIYKSHSRPGYWKASGYLQGSPHGVKPWEAEYQEEAGRLKLTALILDYETLQNSTSP